MTQSIFILLYITGYNHPFLAEVIMKMLTYFNNEGVFKNDDIWFPTYYTMNTCWNYSDASIPLAKVGFTRLI